MEISSVIVIIERERDTRGQRQGYMNLIPSYEMGSCALSNVLS